MATRRIRLVAIVGVVSCILVSGGLGSLSSVSAQVSKGGIKSRGKEVGQKSEMKWESLTPEKQKQLGQTWQTDAAQAKQKWQTLTPEQQQQAIAHGKTGSQKGKKKWQELPAGTTSTAPAKP